jgi:hypothetical protein
MIRLIREEVLAEDAAAERHLWPVKFTAAFTDDEEPAPVFVMQQAEPGEFGVPKFSCVASAVQMYDLPVDEPGGGTPFYRVAEVTLLCRSAVAAEEAGRKVKEAVQDLVDNLASAARLSVVDDATITPSDH